MKNIFFPAVLLCLILFGSCERPHSKMNYMPLVEELHKIECEQMKSAGAVFTVSDTNIYTFRGAAFDRIMTKNPNAVLIAHYEDLNQKLAAMEFEMDEKERSGYREDFKNVYLRQCK